MIYSFMYVLIMAAGLVLIQKLDMSIPPLFSLLVTAIIATVYFNVINKNHLRKIYKDCFENKKQWFLLMVTVFAMWVISMIGPGLVGASLFNFIYFAWLGILGALFANFQSGHKHGLKIYFSICLFLLIVTNAWFELQISWRINTLFGILLGLLGGTVSYIYFKQSQALAKNAKLSATQVLAVRFYLSIFVLIIFIPKTHVHQYLTYSNAMNFIILAFCSLIIPLYFSQKALEKITPEQHAIINSLCPLLTAGLQEIIFRDLRREQIIIYILYTLTITGFHILNKQRKTIEISR